jgi:ribokinase
MEIPVETVKYVIKYAHSKGIRIILNPSPVCSLEDDLFGMVDYFIANESESEYYTGESIQSVQDAVHCVQVLQNKKVAVPIITLGEKVVVYIDGQQILHIPARKVKAIDTTAAGDSFAAAFAVAAAEGKSITDALQFATAVSSIVVTRKGAQTSLPARAEVALICSADPVT